MDEAALAEWMQHIPPDVEVVHTVTMRPDDDGPKGYYGPAVELVLWSDGSVRWRYEGGDA